MEDWSTLSFSELVDRSETCPGREVYFLKRRIASSYHVFQGNCQELIKVLKALSDPGSVSLRWQKKRREHDLIMREVARLLHNFACSIESLGQHVRRIIRKAYTEGGFKAEYDEKVQDTFHSPFAQFMQELRDYAVHSGIPPFGDQMVLKLKSGKVIDREMGIFLDVQELKQRWKWKGAASKYLDGLDTEKIDLLNMVEEYHLCARSFYRWLDDALEEEHRAELQEFRAITEEIGRRIEERDSKAGGSMT